MPNESSLTKHNVIWKKCMTPVPIPEKLPLVTPVIEKSSA
jgi:hypothetical protein